MSIPAADTCNPTVRYAIRMFAVSLLVLYALGGKEPRNVTRTKSSLAGGNVQESLRLAGEHLASVFQSSSNLRDRIKDAALQFYYAAHANLKYALSYYFQGGGVNRLGLMLGAASLGLPYPMTSQNQVAVPYASTVPYNVSVGSPFTGFLPTTHTNSTWSMTSAPIESIQNFKFESAKEDAQTSEPLPTPQKQSLLLRNAYLSVGVMTGSGDFVRVGAGIRMAVLKLWKMLLDALKWPIIIVIAVFLFTFSSTARSVGFMFVRETVRFVLRGLSVIETMACLTLSKSLNRKRDER